MIIPQFTWQSASVDVMFWASNGIAHDRQEFLDSQPITSPFHWKMIFNLSNISDESPENIDNGLSLKSKNKIYSITFLLFVMPEIF